MGPSVWAITGIKFETFDDKKRGSLLSEEIIGRLNQTSETIMHGETSVDIHGETSGGDFTIPGYAYLHVSLQGMEDFKNMTLAERGLGAASGGFISSSNSTCSSPFITEQQWGVIDTSKAQCVGVFYSTYNRYCRVMVCFDRTNVAAVSGFWRNETVLIGPNTWRDKTDWGRNVRSDPDTGHYGITLEEGKSRLVEMRCLCLFWGRSFCEFSNLKTRASLYARGCGAHVRHGSTI